MRKTFGQVLFYSSMALYLLVTTLLLPLFAVAYLLSRDLSCAFGWRFLPFLASRGGRDTFVHAASVGEATLAWNLFGDSVTYTWFNAAARTLLHRRGARAVPLPPDSPLPLLLFFIWHRPAKLVLIEQEIWPALLVMARLFGVRLFLLNGLMYDRSYPSQLRLSAIYGNLFALFERAIVQTESDKIRLVSLGCDSARIDIAGNYKLCLADNFIIPRPVADWGKKENPLLVFASAHPEEFSLFGRVMTFSTGSFRFAAAPIRTDTVPQLAAVCRENGFVPLALSMFGNDINRAIDTSEDRSVILVDSVGLLATIYRRAAVVVMGGSFNGKGAQNFGEPLLAGVPVVIGPSHHNFQPVYELFREAGILETGEMKGNTGEEFERLARRISELCAEAINPDVRKETLRRVENVITLLKKTSEKQRELISKYIL